MLGDEAQPAENARRDKAASGPRHAAPRKSLLTKLHMPAGKAVALAAMPTAMLMGLGFTPHLAQADELPKSPFKPGPCVTQPDTPSPDATGTAGAKKKDTKDSKDASASKDADSSKDTSGSSKDSAAPEPTTSPDATTTQAPKPSASPSADAKQPESAPKASPSATPSPTKSVNPLDPLGLGDLLGGLLGVNSGSGSDSGSSATTAPTPAPSATTPAAPKPKPTTTTPPSVSDTVKSTVETADTAVKDVKDVKDTVKGVTDGASKTTKGVTKGLTDVASGKDPAADPEAFPCPSYDAEALADAKVEKGIPLLADRPWVLKSSLLTLYGLSYDGIVQVKTYSGTVKDVLKFTASGVDIGDLSQTVEGPNGTKTHVTAREGSTSTIRNGTVTMYTESISGNLFGAVPLTFTPKAPPPLSLPVMFFTDATVIQAAQFGGDLTVPGMKVLPNQAS